MFLFLPLFNYRYSHCSVQKPSGEVIIHGGFGCLPDSGMHSRLDSMIGLNVCESGFKIHNIKLCNDQDSTIGKNYYKFHLS